jgi:putative SOS response-associated peptidase YedK
VIYKSRPLFAFAGIWRLWTGEPKGEHQLFVFLTAESNDVFRPVHAKAMQVRLPAIHSTGTDLSHLY